jgi:hypothetical protein
VSVNPFDQASRYAAHQLDEPGFLAWLLPGVVARYSFHRWLPTRNTPFPGEPERICDTVAAWTHQEATAPPLATVIEFLTEASTGFLEHLAEYSFDIRRDHPYQAKDPLVRYEVIGVVVALTGEQAKKWRCRPPGLEGAGGEFTAIVRNLASQSARQTLTRIKKGKLSRGVLPWTVLMQNGGESGNIAMWKEIATTEPDPRQRADYGGLALVFAELAGSRSALETALEDWNMVESEVVKSWQKKARDEGRREGLDEGRREGLDEGRAEAMRASLSKLLQTRSGQLLPQEVIDKLTQADLNTLQSWFDIALSVGSLDEFRTRLNGA